jgi:four helix bundle protein
VQKKPLKSYRELIAWQRGMSLVEAAEALVRVLGARNSALSSQLMKAALSVPSNIAEGYGRAARGEYLHFLAIAVGSLREVETLALIARRRSQAAEEAADRLLAIADETGKVLYGLRKSLTPETKRVRRWPG